MRDLSSCRTLTVRRCAPRLVPKASNPAAAQGLRYEKNVIGELRKLATELGGSVEHNPWFEYKPRKDDAWKIAVPDGILVLGDRVFVIECKLTYVPEARHKLLTLYVPIVRAGLCATPATNVYGVIITRALTIDAAPVIVRLAQVLDADPLVPPTLLWLGHGRIVL